jgi:hypothetical protein
MRLGESEGDWESRGSREMTGGYDWVVTHLPDIYMFCKWFVSGLHDLLRNEVLKKGYNTKFSTIEQLHEPA